MKLASAPLVLILALAWFLEVSATIEDAQPLQEEAIKRLNRYIDHFRRTFDQQALRNELIEAVNELERSIELFQRAGKHQDAAHSMVKLGDALRYLNRWDAAIDVYQEAAAEARAASAPGVEVNALLGNARAYLYGKKTSGPALELVRQALPLARRTDDPSFVFDAWDLFAQVQITEGDYVGAADSMSRAFAVQNAIRDDEKLFYGYLDRADVYQHFAEKCDYERDFGPCLDAVERARRDYEAAQVAAKRLGWDGLARETQGFISRLDLRKMLIESQQNMHAMIVENDILSATEASDVVISEQYTAGRNPQLSGLFAWIETQGGLPPLDDARGAYIKGLLNEAQGERDDAVEWYLRAVELLEEDRGFLYDERARGAYIEDKVEFYYTAMLNLLQQGRTREAFNLMERSRSRVMSDLLATKKLVLSTSEERTLYADLLELRGKIARLQNCLFAVRSDKEVPQSCRDFGQGKRTSGETDRGVVVVEGDGAGFELDPTKLKAALEEQQSAYNALQDRIAEKTPELARLVTSEPVQFEALQRTLGRDGSEVIAYATLESQVIIWHVGPTSLHVRSVFLPRSVLKDKIARLRKTLVDPKRPYDDKTAHELYLYLIAPVEQWIKSGRLVIVAHEDLHYFPFSALQTERGKRYLGQKYQLSYAPSATVLTTLEPARSLEHPHVLAAADPSLEFGPSEVRAIGRRFGGQIEADVLPKETDIKAWVSNKELVHLAVHGTFSADEPLLSHLKLGAGKSDDGKLTAAEMYGLSLDAAQLVVLSACETGSVHASHANEVIGMMRGLIFAGADSLLLSAWKIDDEATAKWMEAFYAAATTRPPAEAAQAAMTALQQNPRYRHPYYWSPFLLISR